MNLKVLKKKDGQSLFEILLAITIGAIIIGSTTAAIMVSLRSGQNNTLSQTGYGLGRELLNNVRSYSEGNWANLYGQTKGTSTAYYLSVTSTSSTSTTLGITSGTTTVIRDGNTFTTWFSLENVQRNTSGAVVDSDGTEDTTMQKITAHISWNLSGDTRELELVGYVGRTRSEVWSQSGWGGSSGVTATFTDETSDYFNATGSIITTATSLSI